MYNSSANDGSLITRSNWRAECVPDPALPPNNKPGMLVTGPDGTRYTMDQFDFYQEEPSWLTTRIEDVHGNWIRVEYTSNLLNEHFISNIYRSG